MKKEDYTYVNLNESVTQEYYCGLKSVFGGEIIGNNFYCKKPGTDISIKVFNIFKDFEISIYNLIHHKSVLFERGPDDNPDLIYIVLIKDGKYTQFYDKQKQYLEAGTSKGTFIYNGLFNISTYFPANLKVNSIKFSFTRQSLKSFIPEAGEIINSLFKDSTPLAYHTSILPQQEALINDIFDFNSVSEFGENSMIIARSIELFTLFIRKIKKMLDDDDLNGLHPDDYSRLIDIKSKLLSNFHQKIKIENLASEYGISTSKLKRDFKSLFSCSIYKFYTTAKMDEAYRRLKSGKFSVMDVGYEMGYQNLSKFSQMFKQVKGINPSEVIPL